MFFIGEPSSYLKQQNLSSRATEVLMKKNISDINPISFKVTIALKKFLRNTQSLKFIYSEKATKFCEIFTLLLSYVVPVKSKVKISQNLVAFSEYMNFNGSRFEIYLLKGSFKVEMQKTIRYLK